MFPDSSIAESFKCGATKCPYLSCFGLFPCFHEQLVDRIRDCTMLLSLVWQVHEQNLSEWANGLHRLILRQWHWSGQCEVPRVRVSWPCYWDRSSDALDSWTLSDYSRSPWMDPVWTGSSTLIWPENAKHRNSPNFWTSAAEKSWKQFKLSWNCIIRFLCEPCLLLLQRN